MKLLRLSLCILAAALCSTLRSGNTPPYLDESLPDDVRIEDALSRMTLDEKIAFIHAQSKFSTPGCPRLGIPELWMSDGPHGVRMEFVWDDWTHAGWTNDSCTALPALTCLAATFNPDLAREYGRVVGEEAAFRRKHVMLGPGVNIYRTPLCGRNFEYMGEDPLLSSRMVVPYIRGMQSQGVAACMKHFILNNQEHDRDRVNVVVGERALNELYLPAFRAGVVDGGVWAVMGSYNKYGDTYCSHNDTLVNRILKDQWGFDGIFMTDWGSAHDTRQAALNGLDLEMGSWTNGLTWGRSNAYDSYFLARPFKDLILAGELPESLLDDKVRRVLRLSLRTNMDRRRPFGRMHTADHLAVAREVGRQGIVLLKNEGSRRRPALLPIPAGKRIAVIGENAVKCLTAGGGSSELKPRTEISPLQGIRDRFGADNVVFSLGYASGDPDYSRELASPYPADSLRSAALDAVRDVDLVIFVGGLNKNFTQDCEGDDRTSFSLPFGQDELIADIARINPNVVLVIVSGNAVAMPWADRIPAIVQDWYLGSMAGAALADILSGDVAPSGKLPFSIPARLEDCAAHHFGERGYPGVDGNVYYDEDLLVGYRWHDTRHIPARYPFGHGLSYTGFRYGKPSLDRAAYTPADTITVTLPLKNVGAVEGAETVQVYARQSHPRLYRPEKELKAFARTQLLPGEEKSVTLSIPAADLAYYDPATHAWTLDDDDFTLLIGSSSTDIRTKATLHIAPAPSLASSPQSPVSRGAVGLSAQRADHPSPHK